MATTEMLEPKTDRDREAVVPIARRTLHDEVASRVRDMIIEGRLEAGKRVNEVALGAQLGVSRTPLREAIKTLASEGLVEIVPARGAVVRTLTLKDLSESLAVIKALEQLAGRQVCREGSPAALAELAALHAAMMDRYAVRDRLAYFKLNQEIHSAIARLSGNAILATAALSFLGLGAQPPTPEWGAMLNAGREFVRYAPWTMIFPGAALFLAVMAVNLIGDRLTQALDPRLAQRG